MLGRKKVDFKGTKNGIVLHYAPGIPFDELMTLVEKKLNQARDFFKGAHVIGVDGPALAPDQEVRLSSLIERESGMKVLTLEPIEKLEPKESTTVRYRFDQSQVEEKLEQPVQDTVDEPTNDIDPIALLGDLVLGDKTVFHRGTLRSGKRIESDGHIIVIGDVNPGAELCAKGNIVVLGALRGFAFAGSDGDDGRLIVALKLLPTQLRIGTRITRPPDDAHHVPNYPEIASVKEQHIIIEPLQ